jgi:hypothetical protein
MFCIYGYDSFGLPAEQYLSNRATSEDTRVISMVVTEEIKLQGYRNNIGPNRILIGIEKYVLNPDVQTYTMDFYSIVQLLVQ